ncbi:hypothetical protein [Glutamicibacter sp. AOP3-A1-12]|uniref:hypothetical protein n=1 Tax=Glutamicibacter sp. AOP3-A1-12 TaxID=3457701 RepID=UPI004033CADD
MTIMPTSARGHSVRAAESEVVEALIGFLPMVLIASGAGVKDPGQVRKWSSGALKPTAASAARLRFLLDQASCIAQNQSREIAAAWPTSANEQLDYELPPKAIREERYKDVAEAAKSFANGYVG